MGAAYSISVSGDDHAENHSRRAYTPSNAERSLQSENIVIYDCGNDREAFNDFFRQAILDYNAKQTRADRKKSLDYLQELEAGREGYGRGDKQEKPFYHHVLQIGNNQTLGVTTDKFDYDHWKQLKKDKKYDEAAAYVKQHLNRSEDRKQMTAVLEEIGRGLQAKYPYCKFWGITIHRDEPHGTDHMDIRYTIFTDGEKNGLGKRVSMNKGLAKMGFKSDRERTALQKFQDAIKADIQAGMEARGYTRAYMDNHEKHKDTSVWQAEQDKEQAIADKEQAESNLHELGQKITQGKRVLAKQAGEYRQKRSESEQLDSWISAKRSELKEVQEDKAAAEHAADEAEKRRRAVDEGAQQYLQFLAGTLKRITDEDVPEDMTPAELQTRVEHAFQRWEDALDAQRRAQDERERAIEDRERKNQDLIRLGRRAKAEGMSTGIQQTTEHPERRLPNVGFQE